MKTVYLLMDFDDFPEPRGVAMTKPKIKECAEDICGCKLTWEKDKLTRGKRGTIMFEVVGLYLYE